MNSGINYNPDVLDALANLSSDEVFTPPKVVNKILDMLPNELWSDSNVTFLDPASKSGVFLREIAKRLIKGLENEIPDLQKRIDHLFTKQLFGIAITELTSLVSRRTLYCSKYADGKYSVTKGFENPYGNIAFDKTEHEWKNGRCKLCGASKQEYNRDESLETYAYEFVHRKPEEILKLFKGKKMKFDVIIGNPPYQLSDGGAQASAMPIYHKFVETAKKLNPRFITMIIPSRWFTGGKGLNNFRQEMLRDRRIREIHDYLNAKDVFPGVDIKGGVNYFLWNRDSKGPCKIVTYENNEILNNATRELIDKNTNIFIRYSGAIPILEKIRERNENTFSDIVSPRKPFGLPTDFTNYITEIFEGALKLYANSEIGYIDSSEITSRQEFVPKYKVYIPYAIGDGNMKTDRLNPILGGPNSVCTETYLLVGPFDSMDMAKSVISYMKTKFFGFLLGLKKNTQHTTQKTYSLIPIQNFTQEWTDEKLYKKYNLTKEEIDFIESMIRPMD
jgi:site-specific DNA-methyltransferase (adenine-specific)